MIPTEVFEVRYPWLVEEFSLVPDSGGAGEHRGGLGVTKRFVCRDAPVTVSHMGDRHKSAPWGLQGGREGGRAALGISRAGGKGWQSVVEDSGKTSPSKFAGLTVRPGDRLWVTNGGGGGWGDPAARDRRRIEEDVRQGFVSADRAVSDYARPGREDR